MNNRRVREVTQPTQELSLLGNPISRCRCGTLGFQATLGIDFGPKSHPVPHELDNEIPRIYDMYS